MSIPNQMYQSSLFMNVQYVQVFQENYLTLYHYCETINEARTKEAYLNQQDILANLSRTLLSTNIQIKISEVREEQQNLKRLAIVCQIKPNSQGVPLNWYEQTFNLKIMDAFQIISYQVIHQVNDPNIIHQYNQENPEVYIYEKHKIDNQYELFISLFLLRKIPYQQLLDKIREHQNKINKIFYNKVQQKICKFIEQDSNIQYLQKIENLLENFKYYKLSLDLNVNPNIINPVNVFQNRLKQIGVKSKESLVVLEKFSQKMEFFIVCEPSQLKIIEINIQNDFINNLEIQNFQANLQELLLLLEINQQEFQIKYEVIVIFEKEDCFQLFGISSSLKSIEKMITPLKSIHHKIFFDNNLIFSELQSQYEQQPFIQIPSKLEFQENKCIVISCKQEKLQECIAIIKNYVSDIQNKTLTIMLDIDQKQIKHLKKYEMEFLVQIKQSSKTQLTFDKTYQLSYATGYPQHLKTIHLRNHGLFTLEYDALISLGQGNITEEIMKNITQTPDPQKQMFFEIPKNQQQYSFSYFFLLNKGSMDEYFPKLSKQFFSLEIKLVALIVFDETMLEQIINLLLFSTNKCLIQFIYIIEPDLKILQGYEKFLSKHLNFSKQRLNNRVWEVQNVYQYEKIDDQLNKKINEVFDHFIKTKEDLQIEFQQQLINITKQGMTLISNKNKYQNLRERQQIQGDHLFIEAFSQNDLDVVNDKIMKKLDDLMVEQQISIPNINYAYNDFIKYLKRKCLSYIVESKQKITFIGFERNLVQVQDYLRKQRTLIIPISARSRTQSLPQEHSIQRSILNERSEDFKQITREFQQKCQNNKIQAIYEIRNQKLKDNYQEKKTEIPLSYRQEQFLWTSYPRLHPDNLYSALMQRVHLDPAYIVTRKLGQAFCLSENPGYFINSSYVQKGTDNFPGRNVMIKCQVTTVLDKSPKKGSFVVQENQSQVIYLYNDDFFRILPRFEVIF